jgi:hypothetical protein
MHSYCPEHNRLVGAVNRLTILHAIAIGLELLILWTVF